MMNDEGCVSLVGLVGEALVGRKWVLTKRYVLSELGRAPSVKRRKCISPEAEGR